VDADMSVDGAIVAVVGAGYEGKRRAYTRMAEHGARVVLVDEPGHWSESLVSEGIVHAWLPAPIAGDADRDARTVLDALDRAGLRPDGVLTFWEDSVCVAARVAAALGLPTNPPEVVDVARSKVRTREMSAELGLPTPKARRVRSFDELYAAAAHVGFPAVVKPEFGASAMGCVRVDDFESLPGVYSLVRSVVGPESDGIFRTGNDLLIEEYLDGVEFDVDLVMQDGSCLFSSVSQNWPTAEPSFQETGLHCPPDHDRKEVRRLVDLVVRTVQGFGLHRGVLHVEGKTTSRGPRIVEVNARLGGGRIWNYVEAVWEVDLVEAQLRSCLDLPLKVKPSRRPQRGVVDAFVYAPATGRLVAMPFGEVPADERAFLELQVDVEIGADVHGPEDVFATVLGEVSIIGKDLRHARALAAEVLRDHPVVAASPAGQATDSSAPVE
jgi:biotin carboxylase